MDSRDRRLRRGLLLLAIAAALSTALSGCNLAWSVRGPYAIGYHQGQLLLAVCEPLQVTNVKLTETVRGADGLSTETVWEAAGEVDAEAGQVFVVSEDNEGLRNIVAADPSPGATTRNYAVLFNEGDRPELSAFFYLPAEGLEEGKWVSPTGERDTPCADEGASR